MNADDWNERYEAELLWGRGPNRFVAEILSPVDGAGRVAVDVACGEGRNTRFLGQHGWHTVGIDYSSVAIDRARATTTLDDGEITYVVGDVTDPSTLPPQADLVLVSYLQVPSRQMQGVVSAISKTLQPGGKLVMVGHAVRNLVDGWGGPRDPDVLWDADELATWAMRDGLEVERSGEVLRPVEHDDGSCDNAVDIVLVAHAPA